MQFLAVFDLHFSANFTCVRSNFTYRDLRCFYITKSLYTIVINNNVTFIKTYNTKYTLHIVYTAFTIIWELDSVATEILIVRVSYIINLTGAIKEKSILATHFVHDELVEITLNLLNLFLVNLLNFLLVVPVPNPTVKGRGFEPAVMCRPR